MTEANKGGLSVEEVFVNLDPKLATRRLAATGITSYSPSAVDGWQSGQRSITAFTLATEMAPLRFVGEYCSGMTGTYEVTVWLSWCIVM
jgi:hypothetical protein